MEKLENGQRYKSYRKWNKLKNLPYDVEDGLVKHITSHKIHETKNKFLKYILQVYDDTLMMMVRSVDVLHEWHNYLWKNR